MSLAGRTAVVTGAGSGIGAAVARALAGEGARVVVADVAAEAAGAVADEIGGHTWVVDLARTHDLQAELERDGLDCDILVNNAGIQKVAPITELDPDDFRRIHAIMVEATFLLCRAALPGMYARGWGRVINLSSVHGLRASPFKSAYVSAKHAMEGLSKTVALEGAAHGVTSNCVNPGYVRTPLVERQIADQAAVHNIPEADVVEQIMLADAAVKRLVEPAEVGALVAWLAGDAAAMITGTSHVIDGGWTAH